MTAQLFAIKPASVSTRIEDRSLRAAVVAINKKFDKEIDHDKKVERGRRAATRCRLEAGELLLALRQRIEGGEAGEEWRANWWGWYKTQPFIRSRADANKVMALASADDPSAAHAEEKTAARKSMRRLRSGANKNVSATDPEVARILRDIEELTGKQRQQLFALLEETYHANASHTKGDGRAVSGLV